MRNPLNIYFYKAINETKMKKKSFNSPKAIQAVFTFCLITLMTLITGNLSAQNWEEIGYKKGDIDLSAGIGLMPTFVGKNKTAPIPPVSLTVSYRVKENIGIGAYLGYSATDYVPPAEDGKELTEPASLRNNFFLAGIRGEGHYIRDRVDFYGGGMLGYNFSINESADLDDTGRIENIVVDDYADKFTWSGFIGVKYLLTKNLGIFGEVGYSVSIFNVGVTARL